MAYRGKAKGHHGLSFDLSKPIKQGILMKQGALHKAFKHRWFVLYPGFLVYYEDQSKWKLDVSRGDTLQSRQGAIKLKNGSCNIARQAPKGCKFGLIVHAPDPQNKRPTYLLNAASKEDRDMWIEAIKQGTPRSPVAGRKNEPKADPKKKEEPAAQPPKYTQRQETVDIAAQVASEEASKNAEESITSIDKEIRGVEDESGEPSLSVRRDTTNSAALSLTSQENSTNIDSVLEEEEPVISIDDALGPAEDDNCSEADILDKEKINELDDEAVVQNGEDKKEEPSEKAGSENGESCPMASTSSVSELTNGLGATEVVTSVVVVCNSEDSEVGGNERGEESPAPESTTDSTATKTDSVEPVSTNAWETTANKEDQESGRMSAEIVIPADERHHNSFTINSNDPDDGASDTDDTEGDGSSIETAPPPEAEQETPPTSPTTPVITVDPAPIGEVKEVTEVTEKEEPKANGDIKQNGEVKQNGDVPNGDLPKLLPGDFNPGRRRSSAFIQKVGYLYKMGGNRKNWKLRYFVLNPGVFFYYKNPKSTKPLGEVKLKNSRVFFPSSGERKTSFQFCVHTESQWNKRQDWIIAAQSDREMKEWIEAFKAAGQKSSPSVSPSVSPSGSPTGSDAES